MITMITNRKSWVVTAAAAVLCLMGCEREPTPVPPPAEEVHDDDHEQHGHVEIPPTVRENLGITFVQVERRPVRGTVRIPGSFELRPAARREYHVMIPGRIELLVTQYQDVAPGTALFVIDSPEWRRIQSDMVVVLNAMKRSHADLAVAEAKLNEMHQAIEFLEHRIANLAEARVRQVDLEAELADKRNTLPRLAAEVQAAHTEFDAAHSRYDTMLNTAESLTGIPRAALDPDSDEHGHLQDRRPPWRDISRLTFHAEAAGVIDRVAVTNSGWAETGDLIVDTIDPAALRFHADALQTDINLFSDGQPARIVPPQGGSIDLQDTVDGHITVGFQAHSQQRTIPIFVVPQRLPRWAKAGVTAYLEVFVAGTDEAVLAIPRSAVIRDGLEMVFFRRNPEDPDEVQRVVADLGASDGRWVEVRSPVREGDEIVLGGVYPLMLASSGSDEIEAGGHFHSDGTFHEEEHD